MQLELPNLWNGTAPLKELVSNAPYFFLVRKDFSGRNEFEEFISLKETMPIAPNTGAAMGSF